MGPFLKPPNWLRVLPCPALDIFYLFLHDQQHILSLHTPPLSHPLLLLSPADLGVEGAPKSLLPCSKWAVWRARLSKDSSGFGQVSPLCTCFWDCREHRGGRGGAPSTEEEPACFCLCCCPHLSPAPCAAQVKWGRSSPGALPALESEQ